MAQHLIKDFPLFIISQVTSYDQFKVIRVGSSSTRLLSLGLEDPKRKRFTARCCGVGPLVHNMGDIVVVRGRAAIQQVSAYIRIALAFR